MNRVRVPLSVVLVLLAVAAVGWIQGLRAAAARHARLQPARAVVGTSAAGDSVAVLAPHHRFALVDLGDRPPARVALYEWMPARTLVRWVEPPSEAMASKYLVIPLEGLRPGEYAVCEVDARATAGPREMDLPPHELVVIARLRVPGREPTR